MNNLENNHANLRLINEALVKVELEKTHIEKRMDDLRKAAQRLLADIIIAKNLLSKIKWTLASLKQFKFLEGETSQSICSLLPDINHPLAISLPFNGTMFVEKSKNIEICILKESFNEFVEFFKIEIKDKENGK